MRIGARIRQVREQRRLTQQDVESRSGVMKCHLSLIENGRKVPALETVERIAKALGISLCWLFYDDSTAPSAVGDGSGMEWTPTEAVVSGPEGRFLLKLRNLCDQLRDCDRELILLI